MSRRVRLETPDGALWVQPDLVLAHMDVPAQMNDRGVDVPRALLVVRLPVGAQGRQAYLAHVYAVHGPSDQIEQALRHQALQQSPGSENGPRA